MGQKTSLQGYFMVLHRVFTEFNQYSSILQAVTIHLKPEELVVINCRTLVLTLLLGLGCAPTHADGGFFLGSSIGSASLNDDFDGLDIDDSSTSFRITGGWRFNDSFALEAGYHNFGDFEQTVSINGLESRAKLSADGFTLGVLGSFPIADKFEIFGRTGMFFWNGDAEINNVSQATPESINPFFGGGISYAINDKLLLSGDWTRYELEDTNSGVFSVGIQYRFGR